jgi:hypothetical protein
MFEIPSLSGIERCIVDEDVIDGKAEVRTAPVDLETLSAAEPALPELEDAVLKVASGS